MSFIKIEHFVRCPAMVYCNFTSISSRSYTVTCNFAILRNNMFCGICDEKNCILVLYLCVDCWLMVFIIGI